MEDFHFIVRLCVNCLCPMALVFLMSDFKYEKKRVLLLFAGINIVCIGINSAVYLFAGREVMMRSFALIVGAVNLVLLSVLTRDRFSMLFFDFFTAINVLYLVSIIGHLIAGEAVLMDAFIRFLLYAMLIFLFRRFFYGPWHFLSKHMKKGWTAVCILPFLFFALVMFLGLYPRVRNDSFTAVLFLYFILAAVYVVLYEVFRSTYSQLMQEENSRLLTAQLAMQDRQLSMQEEYLERMRVLRHDFRHNIHALESLLNRGELQTAQNLLGQVKGQFDEPAPAHYCTEPFLNAQLSWYADKAKREGIEFMARVDLPKPLFVDAQELSMVFGNALENAYNACVKLPEGKKRRIEVICNASPQFVFEIANTWDGKPVSFDAEGYPCAREPGHGIGSRSIAGFVQKYGAIHDYKTDSEMFRLRILIPAPSFPSQSQNILQT